MRRLLRKWVIKMVDQVVIRNYAKAFLKFTSDEKDVAQLAIIAELYKTCSIFRWMLTTTTLSFKQKRTTIETVFDQFEQATQLFLCLLIKKNRANILSVISPLVEDLYLAQHNKSKISIITATDFSTDKVEVLVAYFEKRFKKTFLPSTKIKKSVIGGVRIQIGNQVFDDTIKNKLYRAYQKTAQKIEV